MSSSSSSRRMQIDNGGAPNNFSATDVNDQQAKLAQRAELAYFDRHRNGTITLYSGQVGDEGWFAPKAIPSGWDRTGPTPNGSRNFVGNPSQPYPHNVGPGLGTADHNGDRESLLDKIRNVTPLPPGSTCSKARCRSRSSTPRTSASSPSACSPMLRCRARHPSPTTPIRTVREDESFPKPERGRAAARPRSGFAYQSRSSRPA